MKVDSITVNFPLPHPTQPPVQRSRRIGKEQEEGRMAEREGCPAKCEEHFFFFLRVDILIELSSEPVRTSGL